MDIIDISTLEANKKPRSRHHALSPHTAVAETSFFDLTTDSPSLDSFRSRAAPGGPPSPSHRRVESVAIALSRRIAPSLPSLSRTNCASSATNGAFSHVPVTHSSPRRKVSRPYLDPRSSDKENSDPSSGSNAGLSPVVVKTSKFYFLVRFFLPGVIILSGDKIIGSYTISISHKF